MTRDYITDAIEAILEDVYQFKFPLRLTDELDSTLGEQERVDFYDLCKQEFDLDSNELLDSATTFGDLILLLSGEQ